MLRDKLALAFWVVLGLLTTLAYFALTTPTLWGLVYRLLHD